MHLDVPFEIVDREAAIDVEKRTVEMTILSDQPIRQFWFGKVILDHSKKAVRMDRMKAGPPLLLNHRTDQQIGVLENVRIEEGKLKATARFSRSDFANDIFEDIRDGIRRNTSGGFVIHEIKLEKSKDGEEDVYRALDWEPFEGSIASIPADITVGVGRSFETEDEDEPVAPDGPEKEGATREATTIEPPPTPTSEVRTTMADSPSPAIQPGTPNSNPLAALEQRTNDYVRFAVIYGNTDDQKTALTEMAREHALAGKSEDELKATIIETRKQWQTKVPVAMPQLNEAEKKKYSISRAVMADASTRDRELRGDTQCFEFDVSQEIEKRLADSVPGYTPHGGFYMPTGLALRGLQPIGEAERSDFYRFMKRFMSIMTQRADLLTRAGLDTQTDTKGQELVFVEEGSFIDLLRKKAMVINLGATVLPGLQGNVAFPKQIGAGTFSWVGENPGADVADSNLTLDQVTLSPKTGMSSTSYSRQLLRQSRNVDVDGLVMSDLVKINALGLDRAALHGSGVSPEPRGIYNTSGVGSVAFGGAITFAKVVDMETAIAAADADIATMAYITTPNVRGTAKKTLEFAAAGASAIWKDGEMNGYRAEATNQISKTLGGGGAEHGIIHGVWEALMIGEWGALEIITDPFSLKKQGMIELTSFMMADIAARYAEAFCKGTGLTP